jgi:glutaredoxin
MTEYLDKLQGIYFYSNTYYVYIYTHITHIKSVIFLSMGRITIFSLDHCPHCIRVKTLFNNLNWDYYNISLDDYPSKKSDMMKLSDRLTVPQIFFNDKHLGGANDVFKLKNNGSLLNLYEELIVNQKVPVLPELQRPTEPVRTTSVKVESLTEPPICMGGTCQSYVSLIKSLLPPNDNNENNSKSNNHKYLDIQDRKLQYFELQRKCFSGSNLVDVLLSKYNFPSGRKEACEVAVMLMDMGGFHHVAGLQNFEDDPEVFYRLKQHSEPLILNTYRVWNDRVGNDPNLTLKYCKKILMKAVDKYTNVNTGLINYTELKTDDLFLEFEISVCEFQKVPLHKITNEDERKCFVINLYNLMIYHAYAKLGVPKTFYQRLAFYSSVSYNLGGDIYSFDDLEHGVLRCNTRQVLAFRPPFQRNDDNRINSVLSKLDNRIHFALNCGGASCPAVKNYTKENVNEELRLASIGFFESNENMKILMDKNTIQFNRILSWYFKDFGMNKTEFLQAISQYLRNEKKATVEEILKKGGLVDVKFEYFEYDWTSNASLNTLEFQKNNLSVTKRACAIL